MFSKIAYTLKQSFSQIGRNKGMSFTAMLAITAMMMILGICFIAFVNVDLFASVIKQDYNVVEVYLDDNLDEADRDAVENKLKEYKGIDNIEYRSKNDAMNVMKARWGENAYLLENLDDNPLPDSYVVRVSDKDVADSLSKGADSIKGVSDITYYQDTVEKLSKVTRFIEIASMVIMTFLIVVAVIIVANTIKLTVFNREKEIGIMKYLGATDWFVRTPFIIEGIILGFVSAVLSTGILYFIYNRFITVMGPDIMRMLSVPVVPTGYLISNLMIIFVALGVGIGTCGSIISIRKFLDK